MSLAQVVYKLTTDKEFAALWKRDPELALHKWGLKLSREEFNFLAAGVGPNAFEPSKVQLAELALVPNQWYQ